MRWGALVSLFLVGCFSAHETVCDDGTVCPASKVCAPAGGACVDPDQLHACDGKADGDHCDLAGGKGVCNGGLCVVAGFCGDGIVTPPEVCDDGNTVSGDGCRADCQKIETCGDGVVDPQEACDDGNTNPSDGCDACRRTTWAVTAGVGSTITATITQLALPSGMVTDNAGNLYICDELSRVLRVDAASRAVTLVAGTGSQTSSGDGGPAELAGVPQPHWLAIDGLGNLFIAEQLKVRRIDAQTGIITTVAGTGSIPMGPPTQPVEGMQATSFSFHVGVIAVDGLGNVYVADNQLDRIYKVDSTGALTTAAIATSQLQALAVDGAGTLYAAQNGRVDRVDSGGVLTMIAGTGVMGNSGDGGPATSAQLGVPDGIAIAANGDVYISDGQYNVVRKVDATTQQIATFAGSGTATGYTGDGGPALAATLNGPEQLAFSPTNALVVVDGRNHVIRSIDATSQHIIRTIAGTGSPGSGVIGEPLTATHWGYPIDLATDSQGRVYVAMSDKVYRVDAFSQTLIAGGGTGGDGGPGLTANLPGITAIAFDANDNLFIADAGGFRVRKIAAATGVISTVAGAGAFGYSGDGGSALAANLGGVTGIAIAANGDMYLAVRNFQVVRKVSGGVITRFAGQVSTPGATGDGGPATAADLNSPQDVAIDIDGNVLIADMNNNKIREVNVTSGTIATRAGDGTPNFGGDGGLATAAQLHEPWSISVAGGSIYIADLGNGRIRKITGTTITTAAGNTNSFLGDHGPASQAGIYNVIGVAVDSSSNIYMIDDGFENNEGHLRKVDAVSGTIATIAGQVFPDGMGPLAIARLTDPQQIVVTPTMTLTAGGIGGIVEATRPTLVEMVVGRYRQQGPTGMLARYRDIYYPDVGGIAFDPASHTLYVAAGDHIDAVNVVDAADADTWTISQLVAGFRAAAGLSLDTTTHTLYVADVGDHAVRAVDLTNTAVHVVAGTPGHIGYLGENVDATTALLFKPTAVAACGSDLYIADTGNNRVRRVRGGMISTVLGDGSPSSSGIAVDAPSGVTCDSLGNLFVTSTTTVRLLPAGSSAVSTIYGAQRTTFPESVTRCLTGVTVVDDATVRIADACTGMLIDLARQVMP
ncbi:MAG: DUF4215 domain-containing protein [Deltaproteobacteria bacterium]|nr:DUF4215 domain-containing protein [Deltaproteobacteria bacterium]